MLTIAYHGDEEVTVIKKKLAVPFSDKYQIFHCVQFFFAGEIIFHMPKHGGKLPDHLLSVCTTLMWKFECK